MGGPSAPEVPSFDEYVAARGLDLLRTAWLLTGSTPAAERLAGEVLARAWPQWRHLAEAGAGSWDAGLRSLLVSRYLHDRRLSADVVAEGGGLGHRDVGPRLHAAMAGLARVDRVRFVLGVVDGQADGQVAAILDEDVTATRRHRERVLRQVAAAAQLPADSVGDAAASLVPTDLSTAAITDPDRPSHRRGARVAGWVASAASLALVVTVATLAGRPSGNVPAPAPTATTLGLRSCLAPAQPSEVLPAASSAPSDVVALVVCPETDRDSVWTGYLPPSQAVTVPAAIPLLRLEPRDAGMRCGDVPQGPAFRMLVQRRDGGVSAYANEAMRCDGWPALAAFYRALAEQEVSTDQERWDDGFLGCPPVLDPVPVARDVAAVPRGARLVNGTLCLHPLPVAGVVPRMRHVVRQVLGQAQLDDLATELARHGSTTEAAGPCARSAALYVARLTLATGRVVELSGSCPDRLSVDFSSRQSLRLGAAAASVVASVSDPSYG